jgi:hypothetical protein
LGQLRKLQQLGFWWSILGKGQCYSNKTYTTFNPINLVVEHANTDYPRKRFPCTNRQAKKFQANCCGYKSRFIFPKKTIGFWNHKMPKFKKFFKWLKRPCRLKQTKKPHWKVRFFILTYFYSGAIILNVSIKQ